MDGHFNVSIQLNGLELLSGTAKDHLPLQGHVQDTGTAKGLKKFSILGESSPVLPLYGDIDSKLFVNVFSMYDGDGYGRLYRGFMGCVVIV